MNVINKKAKKVGKITPPCRVPEFNFTIDEKQFAHFTQAYIFENQQSNMATRAIGQFLCNSFINKAYLFILSNAFADDYADNYADDSDDDDNSQFVTHCYHYNYHCYYYDQHSL